MFVLFFYIHIRMSDHANHVESVALKRKTMDKCEANTGKKSAFVIDDAMIETFDPQKYLGIHGARNFTGLEIAWCAAHIKHMCSTDQTIIDRMCDLETLLMGNTDTRESEICAMMSILIKCMHTFDHVEVMYPANNGKPSDMEFCDFRKLVRHRLLGDESCKDVYYLPVICNSYVHISYDTDYTDESDDEWENNKPACTQTETDEMLKNMLDTVRRLTENVSKKPKYDIMALGKVVYNCFVKPNEETALVRFFDGALYRIVRASFDEYVGYTSPSYDDYPSYLWDVVTIAFYMGVTSDTLRKLFEMRECWLELMTHRILYSLKDNMPRKEQIDLLNVIIGDMYHTPCTPARYAEIYVEVEKDPNVPMIEGFNC